MIKRAALAAAVAVLSSADIAGAQTRGVAITPFVGLGFPGRDLLLRPGGLAGRDQEKQSLMAVVGGRIAIGLPGKLQLEGDIGYGSSGLKVTSLSAPSGTDASVLTLSGRLGYRFKSPLDPFWLTVHAGVASVRRSFSERSGQPQTVADETSVGPVIGGSLAFRMTSRTAFIVGIEEFIYNASFDVAAAGNQPAGRSPSLTQNDLRITLGVRIPLLGL